MEFNGFVCVILAKRQWNKAQVQVLESKKPFGLDMSSLKASPSNDKVFIEVAMKFTFQIDSIIINLYSCKCTCCILLYIETYFMNIFSY